MPQDELARTIERLADLGHLSSGVGHHVINAYAAIVSNCEILRLTANRPGAADPAAVADLIVKTAVDASAVARRLIDYTRSATAIGTGQVLLHELISEVVESERLDGKAGVSWTAELTPVPPIVGHDVQIRAMLRHLILNAYEAMPPQGGAISLTSSQDGRGWVVLEMRDNGKGMEPAVLERAVEPFFTTKHGHFGVGLSIANGIWRRHQGTLALRSQVGDGTTVRLCVEPSKAQTAGPPVWT